MFVSMDKIAIYTDGAARGNPGPSASGYSIYLSGRQIAKGEKFNGNATNNFAEYNAVILTLEWCIENVSNHRESAVRAVFRTASWLSGSSAASTR